jgi:aminopeptidase
MEKSYTPPANILKKYAELLVFALNDYKGIKKGDVVKLNVEESAKPILIYLYEEVLKQGGMPMISYAPDDTKDFNLSKSFFSIATDAQLKFFNKKFYTAMSEYVDHSIAIISEADKESMKGVDPKKIMTRGLAFKPYMKMVNDKENKGKYSWTLGLYGTPAMAKEAGLTEKEYWGEIIKACFLDKKDPKAEWKKVNEQIGSFQDKLNKLNIEKLHVEGPDADLWVKLSPKSKWVGGTGRNVPSFEVFTSPDWRGTTGWIRFSEKLYRYGNIIEGVELWFEKGKVVKAKAKKGEKILKEMIATKNADKIGEYSLTDSRTSRITKFMAETLFDENVGGEYGNTHLALGNSYHDCYKGDPSKVTKAEWKKLGYNDSSVHTDIVSTTKRTVTATLPGGKTKVIYKDGKFTV